jgi:hypothetical protein
MVCLLTSFPPAHPSGRRFLVSSPDADQQEVLKLTTPESRSTRMPPTQSHPQGPFAAAG